MNINYANGNNQSFKGFVNIKGYGQEAKMVNTSDILTVTTSEKTDSYDRTWLKQSLFFRNSSGEIQSISAEGLAGFFKCSTKDDLYDKFSKTVAQICHKADMTGEILDIQL